MTHHVISRRDFLAMVSATARHSLIVLSAPAILTAGLQSAAAQSAAFTTLTATEAEALQAIAARIIPTDATPGATEAGVIYFMDTVLGSSRAEVLAAIRAGLESLQSRAQADFGSGQFDHLSTVQQDALLTAMEDTAFFDTVRYLTIAGMFCLPEYGGNRNKSGWQLLGFEDRHMWQPPFGFYDTDYLEQGA